MPCYKEKGKERDSYNSYFKIVTFIKYHFLVITSRA